MPSEHPEARSRAAISSGLRKWILLICIMLPAAALYWNVSYNYTAQIVVHPVIKNIPNHLMLTRRPVQALEIQVCGPESIVKKLKSLNLVYPIDLSEAKPGINRFRYARNRFPLPAGICIRKIYQPETTIVLAKYDIKKLPVFCVLSGKPAFGYEVGNITAKPAMVTLKGPESIIKKLSQINTSPIDITGLAKPVIRSASLNLPENVIIMHHQAPISVHIDIHKKIIEKKFQNIKIYSRHAPYDCVIRPDKINITVSGPFLSLAKKNIKKDVEVYIDLSGLKPGIYVKPATILLPEGISLVVADPQLFTVEIRAPSKKN